MKQPEYVYAVVSQGGGSGRYAYSRFLGLAFSWEEVRALVDENRKGPCPGERHEVERRRIGVKSRKHLTIWKCESWDEVAKRKWHT